MAAINEVTDLTLDGAGDEDTAGYADSGTAVVVEDETPDG